MTAATPTYVLREAVMSATEGQRPHPLGWRERLGRLQKFLTVSKYIVGILLILLVTVIWVGSSEWIQYIFGDLEYSKPYFLTFFNTTGFCFWNLGYLFVRSWRVPLDDVDLPQPIYLEDTLLHTSDEDAPIIGVDEEEKKKVVRHKNGKEKRTTTTTTTEAEMTERSPGQKPFGISAGTLDQTGSQLNTPELDNMNAAVGSGEDALRSEETAAAAATRYTSYGADMKANHHHHNNAAEAAARAAVATADGADETAAASSSGAIVAIGAAPHPLFLPKRSKLLRPYSMRRIWVCASLFCVFWFVANCLFNYSLNYTSVASNTALSSTSSVWTLLLSFFLPNVNVGPMKWIGVAVCVAGTVMVALSDSDRTASNEVLGDMLAIVSAMFYALYTTVLKLGLPDDDRYAMGMVFGAVGVINLLFLWPGILVLDAAHIEHFQWPTWKQFGSLLANALIGTNLSDVIWARSVVLTSPVIATLGLSLTTPLSMVADAIIYRKHFAPMYIAGALLIMFGFIFSNLPILDGWRFSFKRMKFTRRPNPR